MSVSTKQFKKKSVEKEKREQNGRH